MLIKIGKILAKTGKFLMQAEFFKHDAKMQKLKNFAHWKNGAKISNTQKLHPNLAPPKKAR
jgi:hypothetical protein